MITLKIGRHSYDITEEDQFLDNGALVQLVTQSKERSEWGNRPNPHLSKRAIKEIAKFDHVQHEHTYQTKFELFSLRITPEQRNK